MFCRDIKPGNVLITSSHENPDWSTIDVQNCLMKLTDFGLAKKFEEVSSSLTISMTPCGTRGYWAPEVQEAYEDGMKAGSHFSMDSYSIGILTFKLVAGNLPTPMEKGKLSL